MGELQYVLVRAGRAETNSNRCAIPNSFFVILESQNKSKPLFISI